MNNFQKFDCQYINFLANILRKRCFLYMEIIQILWYFVFIYMINASQKK